mmetsp:Transcript_139305/g.347270  ORF Transcript_139305/g.347270 Transcript_139305/m.347270 type:complete len:470 (-) Transcript_139305:2962-4371(-)
MGPDPELVILHRIEEIPEEFEGDLVGVILIELAESLEHRIGDNLLLLQLLHHDELRKVIRVSLALVHLRSDIRTPLCDQLLHQLLNDVESRDLARLFFLLEGDALFLACTLSGFPLGILGLVSFLLLLVLRQRRLVFVPCGLGSIPLLLQRLDLLLRQVFPASLLRGHAVVVVSLVLLGVFPAGEHLLRVHKVFRLLGFFWLLPSAFLLRLLVRGNTLPNRIVVLRESHELGHDTVLNFCEALVLKAFEYLDEGLVLAAFWLDAFRDNLPQLIGPEGALLVLRDLFEDDLHGSLRLCRDGAQEFDVLGVDDFPLDLKVFPPCFEEQVIHVLLVVLVVLVPELLGQVKLLPHFCSRLLVQRCSFSSGLWETFRIEVGEAILVHFGWLVQLRRRGLRHLLLLFSFPGALEQFPRVDSLFDSDGRERGRVVRKELSFEKLFHLLLNAHIEGLVEFGLYPICRRVALALVFLR